MNNNKTEKNNIDDVSAICIVFKNDAVLGRKTGVKFYNDSLGSNCIKSISAAKEEKKKLTPLLFKMGNVWCNTTQTPESKISLPAIVYCIP